MDKIVTILFGSNMYGTTTPESDIDLKSVYIPTGREIVLGTAKETFNTKRPKGLGEKNYAGEKEEEILSLKQFLKLVSEGQTVSMDMLFAPKESIIDKSGFVWFELQINRNKLLSKKSEAFVGYCRQQAKKYGIKGSRVAAVRDTLAFLDHFPHHLQKLGVAEDILAAYAKDREFVEIVEIPQPSGVMVKHLEVCGRKLPYTATIKNAIDVLQKLMNEYGTRALMAERNEGVDWKALSHAVRIGQEAIELFNTGNITFPRPNAGILREIKMGRFDYKEVAEEIEDLFVLVEEAARKSSLPEEVDQEWIDNFVFGVYSDAVRYYRKG
jgi:hypothetical protein